MRRMVTGPQTKWRTVLQGAVGEIQLSDLLRGNMNGLQVKKPGLPEFYSGIITEYFRLKPSCQVTNAMEVKGQTLWYNKAIQINHNIVFLRNMYRQGIKYVSQLESNGELLTYLGLLRRYPELRINLYRYQCLQQLFFSPAMFDALDAASSPPSF